MARKHQRGGNKKALKESVLGKNVVSRQDKREGSTIKIANLN